MIGDKRNKNIFNICLLNNGYYYMSNSRIHNFLIVLIGN